VATSAPTKHVEGASAASLEAFRLPC
jgi:hypothetical protein